MVIASHFSDCTGGAPSEGQQLLPAPAPQGRGADPVLDGLPLSLAEERREGDGNVSKHKQWEGEGVQDLLHRLGMDPPPLGNGGDGPQHKQRQIHIQQHLPHGPQGDGQVLPPDGSQHSRRHIAHDGRRRQDKGRHNGRRHIVAGEAPPGRAPCSLAP